jgi:hypothetical protein
VGGYPVLKPVRRAEPLAVPDVGRREWLSGLAEQVETAQEGDD